MRLVSRGFSLFALIAHALISAAAAFLLARGFPFSHPHFWVNQVLPIAVCIACVVAVVAGLLKGSDTSILALAAIGGAWVGGAVVAWFLFPASGKPVWLLAIFVGLLLFASVSRPLRRSVVIAGLIGAVIGAPVPFAQRAPLADTRPLNVALDDFDGDANAGRQSSVVLGHAVRVSTSTGSIAFTSGSHVVTIEPLLTFESRSPDRCWTNLAPAGARISPSRILSGQRRENDSLRVRYQEDDLATLEVSAGERDQTTVESVTRLPRPVYSHLNSFAQVFVAGHKRLFVKFSPCGDARFEVLPEDYPFGRPGRSAFVDAAGVFHVVQATSGEKGPFHELGRGSLARGSPLTMTLFDGDRPFADVTLDDWSAQASTQLSPTAGWGLAVNAIEFNLEGDSPAAPATFFITQAATSVGRGWDSVGHAAGTYRNRMHMTWRD